jgi:hypothetical protein
MSIRQGRRLGLLAEQIRDSRELPEDIRDYLVGVFGQIAEGKSADAVLGLTRKRGDKALNEAFEMNLARIFPWIMAIRLSDPDGYGLSVTHAIEAASNLSYGETWEHPKKGFVLEPGGLKVFEPITPASLRRAWYNPKYTRHKKLEIDHGSFDFSYFNLR